MKENYGEIWSEQNLKEEEERLESEENRLN